MRERGIFHASWETTIINNPHDSHFAVNYGTWIGVSRKRIRLTNNMTPHRPEAGGGSLSAFTEQRLITLQRIARDSCALDLDSAKK